MHQGVGPASIEEAQVITTEDMIDASISKARERRALQTVWLIP